MIGNGRWAWSSPTIAQIRVRRGRRGRAPRGPGARVVALVLEPVRAGEMRAGEAELASAPVHSLDELADASGVVLRRAPPRRRFRTRAGARRARRSSEPSCRREHADRRPPVLVAPRVISTRSPGRWRSTISSAVIIFVRLAIGSSGGRRLPPQDVAAVDVEQHPRAGGRLVEVDLYREVRRPRAERVLGGLRARARSLRDRGRRDRDRVQRARPRGGRGHRRAVVPRLVGSHHPGRGDGHDQQAGGDRSLDISRSRVTFILLSAS